MIVDRGPIERSCGSGVAFLISAIITALVGGAAAVSIGNVAPFVAGAVAAVIELVLSVMGFWDASDKAIYELDRMPPT